MKRFLSSLLCLLLAATPAFATLGANVAWEVRPTNGLDTNGGGFCLAVPTYPNNLAATVATSSAPVVTSATYNFVAGDVGKPLYIKAGTNWIPGFYSIVSVASNAATLGQACATVASPTAGSWAIDYSQQNAAQFSGTDLASTIGTTNPATVTSAGHTFTQADVGNFINVSAGTNWTQRCYQINSVAAGVATVDAAVGSAASLSSGTWALGGAQQTIGKSQTQANSFGTAGNKFFVKAEATITTAATITLNAPAQAPTQALMPNRLIGYTTSRTDAGQVTIQLITNTGLFALDIATNGWVVENFIIDCNSLGTSTGIRANTGLSITYVHIRNCVVKNFKTIGMNMAFTGGPSSITSCEVTGGLSGATSALNCGNTSVSNSWIHDNVCPGLVMAGGILSFNLISNNSGASSDGIQVTAATLQTQLLNNTVYTNGRDGIRLVSTINWPNAGRIQNNILVKNGGYGLNASAAGMPAMRLWDGNAYWSNTSGARNNMDDGAAGTAPTNFINLSSPYVNTLDVTLTGDPFISSSTNDYRLNSTPGAGNACRAKGTPTTWLNGTANLIAYPDMGAVQHRDPPIRGPAGMGMLRPPRTWEPHFALSP